MRVRIALVGLAAVVLAPFDASATTTEIDGTFTSVGVLPPACSSFLCTEGQLAGDIEGTYFFTMTSLAPDPARPGTFRYAGTSTISTAGGTMVGDDTGFMVFTSGNPAPFETTVTLVSGTGDYADVTGSIVAVGALDFTSNTATGTYTGTLITP